MPSAITHDQLLKQIGNTQAALDAIDKRVEKYRAYIENSPNLKKEYEARLAYLQVIRDSRPAPTAAADPSVAVLTGDPANDDRFVDPNPPVQPAQPVVVLDEEHVHANENLVGLTPRPVVDNPQA